MSQYLHISISVAKSAPEHIWVQWARDANRVKTAEWENAFFHPDDRDEIKRFLMKLVEEL